MFENLTAALARLGATPIANELAGVDAEAMAFLDGLKAHLVQRPEPVFAVLRRVRPILILKGVAIVTRFDDVQEVLLRDNVFQVTYGPKMRIVTGGNDFFLGMQDSPEYARDVSHMRTVMRREDIPDRIVPFVRNTAAELVAAAGSGMDVVKQLSLVVPVRWIGDYFGCPPTSDEELAAWGSTIFRYLFTDLTNDPAVDAAALDASAKMRGWLDQTIASRKASPQPKDDVLGRCLALQATGVPGMGEPGMNDIDIRNNLLGLVVGAIATTSKCCAQALDQLLDRPDQLAGAQAAAQADDDALLAQYVFEALRFNPNSPGVFRIAAEDYPLAKGAMHGITIPRGTSVLAATQSAMFDDLKVDQPGDFRIDRPAWLDMRFGYGLHSCFGQYVNRVQIPGILKPLLRKKQLQRAGPLQYAGPFPSSLPVTFGN